jgi:DNA repair protein RecN (Recombination protein N)
MLRELRIRDYAVIDDLRLELVPGLNVLTGETGAGKSIIVGALSLLLGERASSDVVRAGERKALVEGVFDVSAHSGLAQACRAEGIEADDGWLILRREVQREGRNRAWVNGSAATAGLIGRLGAGLVDLHGQHEHQALLRRDAQRAILDSFADATDLGERTAAAHSRLQDVRRRIDETRERADETRERADDLEHRAREIGEARLEPGEDEATAAELRRLEHSEELMELSATLHRAVYGDDASVVDRLGDLSRPLDDLARIDPVAAGLKTLHAEARAVLEELGRRLSEYHNSVEHDPGRLGELRSRLDLIYRLKRKYGDTLAEVIAAGEAARAELEAADKSSLDLDSLEREAEAIRSELERTTSELSRRRQDAADRLAADVTALLSELGMEGGVFQVHLDPLAAPGAHGAERTEFRVSLNPGFDPGPLARVASGGELSRVMLALKTVLAGVDAVPCLVFDEIDSGIGGRVAHRVAARLADVATAHQVFAITHLPQIAARAHEHLYVEKVEAKGRAAARVRRLEGSDRIDELARMLGGDPESQASRRHAIELLSEESEGVRASDTLP